MGLFTKPEVVVLKESSDAEEYLRKLEELLPQASGKLKDKIQKEIAITKAGIIGEDAILFELKNSGMDMVVLRDILIKSEDISAQIDFIVVTPKINFIIECKNLFGNIEITSKGDFVRTMEFGGKKVKEGIYSPITQNERHLNVIKEKRREGTGRLSGLIKTMSFDSFYKSLIVLANPKTIVNDRYAKKEVKDKVIRGDQLIATMKRMNKESRELKSNKKDMQDIANRLLSFDSQERRDYFEKYEVLIQDMKQEKVVTAKVELPLAEEIQREEKQCPRCGGKLMVRTAKKGDNAGKQFLGCSSFPKCRYIQAE